MQIVKHDGGGETSDSGSVDPAAASTRYRRASRESYTVIASHVAVAMLRRPTSSTSTFASTSSSSRRIRALRAVRQVIPILHAPVLSDPRRASSLPFPSSLRGGLCRTRGATERYCPTSDNDGNLALFAAASRVIVQRTYVRRRALGCPDDEAPRRDVSRSTLQALVAVASPSPQPACRVARGVSGVACRTDVLSSERGASECARRLAPWPRDGARCRILFFSSV